MLNLDMSAHVVLERGPVAASETQVVIQDLLEMCLSHGLDRKGVCGLRIIIYLDSVVCKRQNNSR